MASVAPTARTLDRALPLIAEGAALGRSFALAATVGADELGRAMVLALMVRLSEIATDLGIARRLSGATGADALRGPAGSGRAALLDGAAAGLVLACAATLLALCLPGGPGWETGALLGLVPLLRGAALASLRRGEGIEPGARAVLAEATAAVATLAAAVGAALVLEDHRAMAAALLVHAVALAATARATSERSSGTRPRPVGAPAARTGHLRAAAGTLALDAAGLAGLLMLAAVGDWQAVAVCGLALQLALLPARVAGPAAAAALPPRFRVAQAMGLLGPVVCTQIARTIVAAVGVAAVVAVGAPPALALAGGEALRPDGALAVALGLAAACRILRGPLGALAEATGRTGHPATAALPGIAAVAMALLAVLAGLPAAWVAASLAAGEAAATVRAALRAAPPLRAAADTCAPA